MDREERLRRRRERDRQRRAQESADERDARFKTILKAICHYLYTCNTISIGGLGEENMTEVDMQQ